MKLKDFSFVTKFLFVIFFILYFLGLFFFDLVNSYSIVLLVLSVLYQFYSDRDYFEYKNKNKKEGNDYE